MLINCATSSCTSVGHAKDGHEQKRGWLCRRSKDELNKSIYEMYYNWHYYANEPAEATPVIGVKRWKYGWLRGARRFTVAVSLIFFTMPVLDGVYFPIPSKGHVFRIAILRR
jgi:hypothetical protein